MADGKVTHDVAAELQAIRRRQQDIHLGFVEIAPLICSDPRAAVDRFQALVDQAEQLNRDFDAWFGLQPQDNHSRMLLATWGIGVKKEVRNILIYPLSGLGQCLSLTGELDRAKKVFLHALDVTEGQHETERASLTEELGRVCFQQGRFDEAEGHFRTALAILRAFTDPKAWSSQEPLGFGFSDEELKLMTDKTWDGVARVLGYQASIERVRGNREEYLRLLDEGITVAREHKQTLLARSMWRQKYEFLIGWDVTGEALDEMDRQLCKHEFADLEEDPAFKLDVSLLKAQSLMEREGNLAAEGRLKDAIDQSKGSHRGRWVALLAYAQFCGRLLGRLEDAIEKADEALNVAAESGIAELIDTARRTLISLCLEGTQPQHRARALAELEPLISSCARSRDAEGLTHALLERARVRFLDGRYEDALNDIDGAQQFAPKSDQLQHALSARCATLQRMGRDELALEAIEQSLALHIEKIGPALDESPTAWRDELAHLEALHEGAAVICARLGRLEEAFAWAEQGKARLLRQRKTRANLPPDSTSAKPAPQALDSLRQILTTESAALAMFCVGPEQTMVLTFAPQFGLPKAEFVALGDRQLKEMLPATGNDSEQTWNDRLTKAVPLLSEILMRPLVRLREAVGTVKVLYVVPDSHLYAVPFAALTFGDGVPLIEHCALAVVPSAAVLAECRARKPLTDRSCLVLGAGDAGGISFAAQAKEIAEKFAGELGWPESKWVPETDATKARFLAEAPRFRVIHLACHGGVQSREMDALSASKLQFADKQLSAKEVIGALGSGLGAELIFLNACRSAGYRIRLGGEVGGFWQAFLSTGVPSLIATLFFVDPNHAQRIAVDFYQRWLTEGLTKAEALRQVQLTMAREGVEFRHWASHILIGDHR